MKFLNRRMLSLAKNICAYGFVIGIALYPGIITTYRYYNTQKVNNPISQSRVIECKLFDVAPRKVEKLVSAIGEESKEELGTEGVDVLAKPPLGQLEEIANKSLPYIASALGHSKVYSPKVAIGYTGGSAGAYYFPIDEARVEDKVTIESSKRIIPHEIIHTQYNASTFLEAIKHAYHEFPFGFTNPPRFHDETFV
ncbi:hypothetical protein HYW99_03525, partial [Candidatus Woesearchaeota archaeon]|nr:hypothetical protein [Candidatus Woesearchaeota archaeon]